MRLESRLRRQESTEGAVRRGSLPIAVIDRIVNGTITTSEFTRWLPAIEILLSAAEDRTACATP